MWSGLINLSFQVRNPLFVNLDTKLKIFEPQIVVHFKDPWGEPGWLSDLKILDSLREPKKELRTLALEVARVQIVPHYNQNHLSWCCQAFSTWQK